MCIASLKHLQKVNFNTKGHFSTLNYDPLSGINFQRGYFLCVGDLLKTGVSLFNVENRTSIHYKLTREVIFQRGHYLMLHRKYKGYIY